MKKTGWYGRTQKPAYLGCYERYSRDGIIYSKWDGHKWIIGGSNPHEADKMTTVSFFQDKWKWRGLKEKA